MITVFLAVGLLLFLSGLLSVAGVTEIGLDFVSKSKIHELPFLNTFLSNWVYLIIGLIILAIAVGLFRRK